MDPFNEQAPVPRVVTDGQTLSVHSIFSTIQGEGPYAGMPATFIRLAGCNLQCPFCDTEYTEGARWYDVDRLVRRREVTANPLVVITGGEPFRQNIGPLCERLHEAGVMVQVETNGKLAPQWKPQSHVYIVVSPKTETVHPYFEGPHHAMLCYKYVIDAGNQDPEDGLPITALGHPVKPGRRIARPPEHVVVYVGPADHKDPRRNTANMKAAVRAVMARPENRRLYLQVHKYAELP